MYPIVLSTPWFNVYSYGLFIAIGYTVGTIWILHEAKRSKVPPEPVFDMLLLQLVVGITGSRILYLLEYSTEPLTFNRIVSVEQGGLTFYGAVISSFVFDFLFLKFKRLPFWQVMDCVGMGLPLGILFARIGCLLNGCCYGTPTETPFGMVFSVLKDNTQRHPTQIYESLAGLLIFVVLQVYHPKRKNYGEAFFASMGLYGFLRFLIEFFRADNPVVILGLTMSQLIGLSAVVLSVAAWKIIGRTPGLRIPCNLEPQAGG